MENKEKRKRKVSILTMFLWLALIVTMSVIVISGISKSNALEDDESQKITIKIDFSELLQNENYDEESKENVIKNMSDVIKMIDAKENVNTESNIEYEIGYIGEEQGIVEYKINVENGEVNYLMFENNSSIWDEYTILENGSRLEDYTNNRIKYLVKNLEVEKNIYEFKVTKNVIKTVTVKIDHTLWIKELKDEIENNTGLLENYLRSFTIRLYDDNDRPIGNIAKYINVENNIATYELDIISGTNSSNYIRITTYVSLLPGESAYKKYYLAENNDAIEFYIKAGVEHSFFKRNLDINKDTYEFEYKDSKNVKIKFDISNMDEISKNRFLEYLKGIYLIPKENSGDKRGDVYDRINFKYKNKTDDYVLYELYLLPVEYNVIFTFDGLIRDYGIYEDDTLLEDRIFGHGNYNYYNILRPDEIKDEYYYTIEKIKPRVISSLKWKKNNIVELQYKFQGGTGFYDRDKSGYDSPQGKVFIENIDENFDISDEYKDDSKWLIINEEEFKDKYDSLDKLFDEHFKDGWGTGIDKGVKLKGEIRYIYVKDKKQLYCFSDKNDVTESINLIYKGNLVDKLNSNFEFNTRAFCIYTFSYGSNRFGPNEYIEIPVNKKEIEYKIEEKTEIVVNKIANENEEDKIYYVGLFGNEEDVVTKKVYSINILNGIGSTTIEIENYNKGNKYYIYEVDENGRKLNDDDLEYTKNRVLENENIVNRYNIVSNKNIVSSVKTIAEVEDNVRLIKNLDSGEENYIDNSMVISKIKEDTVTISPRGIHIVKYETEHHGNLEGETKEAVKHGEKPVNIPKIIPNKNYEFEKWVVIKDGEEIEVNPSEYIILEDTTFIAKYKEIKVVDEIDTSDINVWLYVGAAVISVICVIIVVISLSLNKKRKTT